MIDPITFISLILLGLLISILSSILGVGGGFLIVPSLVILYGVNAEIAIGTSLATIVFTSISATIAYYKQNLIDWKLGLLTAGLSVPAASLGAYIVSFISSESLSFIFGFFLLFTGLRNLVKGLSVKKTSSNTEQPHPFSRVELIKASPFLFASGLLSGLLGVGGGVINVPIYSSILKRSFHVSVATSMFAIIFTSLSGTITHLTLGNISFHYSISLIIGVIVGAQIGARVASKITAKYLQIIFGAFVMMLGLYMLITYFPL